MEEKSMKSGASMFSRSTNLVENDPFEEIFTLNLGDFLTEHLISEEFALKIKDTFMDKAEGLKKQLKELVSIYSIDNTLSLLGFNNSEDYILYNAIAKTMVQMLEFDSCHIFLHKSNTKLVEDTSNDIILVGTSLDLDERNILDTKIGYNLKTNEIASQAFNSGRTYSVKNIQDRRDFLPIYKLKENTISDYVVVPMHNNYESVGLIILENYNPKEISKSYLNLVKITGKLFATSMNLQKLSEETNKILSQENPATYELQHLRAELTATIGDLGEQQQQFVEYLAKVVDDKGQYAENHSQEIADLSRELCNYIGLNEKTTDLIYYAGLLQNIGKITLPKEIFAKKDKLTSDEWNKLQKHPNVGVSLLMHINFLSEVVPYIHYNRERWNGEGKPEGLKGYSIPLGSRIIAVADAYCALTTDRSFRKALSNQEALNIMQAEANEKWDPVIVDALVNIKNNL